MKSETKKSDNLRGPAAIRVLAKTVQIRMLEHAKDGKYAKGQVYEVPLKDTPENLIPGEPFWVAMNGQGTILYAQSPVTGDFFFRFKEWRAKPGDIPMPRFDPGGRTAQGRNGPFVTRPSTSMDAIYEIVDGKYTGLTAMAMYPYIYEAGDDGNAKYVGTAAQVEKVEEFHEANGIADEDFPYQGNLLPALGEAIVGANKVILGKVEGGLIRSMSKPPDGYKAPKLAARKSASKTTPKKNGRK